MRSNTLALGLLAVLLGVVFSGGLSGCGDDSGSSMDASAGDGDGGGDGDGDGDGDGTGGRMDLPRVDAGDGDGDGDAGGGEGSEGAQCGTANDCDTGLECVFSGLQGVGICARSCMGDSDCGAEICFTYSGLAIDRHCINVIREEYAFCGAAETSNCSSTLGLDCLYLQNSTIGVCVSFCASGGSDTDAGVSDAGADTSLCEGDQTCIGGIVRSNGVDNIDGICGMFVDRGEACGIDLGNFCDRDVDICGNAEPTNLDSVDYRCFEDCTEGQECAAGTTCTPFRDLAYCL